MTARVLADDDSGRAAAADVLRSGGVVALPTDTVYGIAVALETPGGIERLFHVKRRPPDRGIMLLLGAASQAASIGGMGPAASALAAALWPGGLTVVVPQRPDHPLPTALTGGGSTIGLRVPDHAAPRALADAIGPLPTTSANRSGMPEARDATDLVAQLGDDIDLVLDGGPSAGGPASTVVDCTGEQSRILRLGAISLDTINEVLARAGLPPALEPDAT
jgi:L-threonylcarbamoyladenylate synthase